MAMYALCVRYTVVAVHKSQFTFGLHGSLGTELAGTYRGESFGLPSPARPAATPMDRPLEVSFGGPRLLYIAWRIHTENQVYDRTAESSSV